LRFGESGFGETGLNQVTRRPTFQPARLCLLDCVALEPRRLSSHRACTA